ncbi:MAG: hypothetical protein NXH91_03390 [Phyllobacteriaceae bacterium]|jgi:hypothetical protein|nr:hypothetical protein [Phyllobacteriaceae bacterium]
MTEAADNRGARLPSERIVGLSVSDSPELESLGFLRVHVDQALASIATQLSAWGIRLGYGGNLDPDGFTFTILDDVAQRYARGAIGTQAPPFVHYLARPLWCDWTGERLYHHVQTFGGAGETVLVGGDGAALSFVLVDPKQAEGTIRADIRKPQLGKDRAFRYHQDLIDRVVSEAGIEPSWLRFPAAVEIPFPRYLEAPQDADALLQTWRGEDVDPTIAFSAMRLFMALDERARIVTGGKTSGYSGRYPGIAEEAYLNLSVGNPVLPLPLFGGAAADVMAVLAGREIRRTNLTEGHQEILYLLSERAVDYIGALQERGAREAFEQLARLDAPNKVGMAVRHILARIFLRLDEIPKA